MQKIFYYIKLLRPFNIIISSFAMLTASAILDGLNNTTTVFLVILVVVNYAAGANALNDAIDSEIDLINCPTRPIPSGMISKKEALIISFLCFSLGTVFCLRLPEPAKVIGIIVSMPLLILYNTHLKGMPLIGNIVVSMILGLSFLFCGAAHAKISPMWLPMVLAFGLTLLRELIKDIADLKGDLSAGLATFPITAGVEKSIRLFIILSICIGIFILFPYFDGKYGIWYGIIVFIGVEIPLMIVVALFIFKPGIPSANLGAKILKVSTLMGLIAIYAGYKL